MIQFNLLPNVKLEFVKARRVKHTVIFASALLAAITFVVFLLLLLFVDIAQKKHLSDINRDISGASATLSNNTNLNKILTIQNQLQALPALDAQKPVSSRLFGYIAQVTPSNATISSLVVDFTQHSFVLSGGADTLSTVNQFVDTLKFTTYNSKSTTSSTTNTKAFSSVVLTSFSLTNGTVGKPAGFSVSLNFDPQIFNAANTITLTVPQITTTRSITERPSDLFQKNTSTSTGGH